MVVNIYIAKVNFLGRRKKLQVVIMRMINMKQLIHGLMIDSVKPDLTNITLQLGIFSNGQHLQLCNISVKILILWLLSHGLISSKSIIKFDNVQ